MTTTNNLPVIGGAMRLTDLPKYVTWLAGEQRDLEIQDPCYPGYLDQDWHADAEGGRDLLASSGYAGRMGVHAAFDGLDLFTQDKRVRDVIQTRFLQSLEFGAVLGATHMVVHSPFITFGSAFANYSSARERQGVIDATHAALEKVLPVAEGLKCVIVIECILDKSPYPLIELVRSFNSDYVRLSIDTGHAFLMQQDGGTPPHEWVVHAGDLLGHVHLQDVDGHADRHWAIGDGNINWHAFFRALRTLSHKPRLVLEVEEIERSMRWLESNGLGC